MNKLVIIEAVVMAQAEELGIKAQVERHLADLRRTYAGAKAVGEMEQAGFILAMAIMGQVIEDEQS